jgi:peptidoglycan/xylan/chitin deacetylase (PgdA/CDA1 family)
MSKLRSYGRRLRDALAPGGLILSYHRIADAAPDPWGIAVSPKHFEEHLEVIRRFGQPGRLSWLTDRLKEGKSVKGIVAITFDDGYADTYRNAYPLLGKHDMPATVFVVSGAIDAERAFWWEELIALLLRPSCLPAVLELPIRGKTHRIELADAVVYSETDLRRDMTRRIWHAKPGTRFHLCHRLWTLFQQLTALEQAELLEHLREWASLSDTAPVRALTMSAQQIRRLASEGLIDIGGHTVTHARLPCHDENYQRGEIETDKATLEELSEKPVTSFAYPHGDHCPQTMRLVQAAGYERACSGVWGRVRGKDNPFLLPRYEVSDCDGDQLARRFFPVFSRQ